MVVYRPSTGQFIEGSSTSGMTTLATLGGSGDVPVTAPLAYRLPDSPLHADADEPDADADEPDADADAPDADADEPDADADEPDADADGPTPTPTSPSPRRW